MCSEERLSAQRYFLHSVHLASVRHLSGRFPEVGYLSFTPGIDVFNQIAFFFLYLN